MIQLSDKPVIVQGNTLMEQEEAAARGIDYAAARQNTVSASALPGSARGFALSPPPKAAESISAPASTSQ